MRREDRSIHLLNRKYERQKMGKKYLIAVKENGFACEINKQYKSSFDTKVYAEGKIKPLLMFFSFYSR